jgi:DNA-binding winged helix-turn-helix (wHTH) protein/TolB-like protein/Flp pilus assembly protein TadD
MEVQGLYEFGDFHLNVPDHSLLRSGKPVSLTPKSFEILVALIESGGRLVTKDELMKRIWPDSFVEEANLTVNVSALRRALGDTPEHQQYIETVPKLGYRFIASVTELESPTHTNSAVPAKLASLETLPAGTDIKGDSTVSTGTKPRGAHLLLLSISAVAIFLVAGLGTWSYRHSSRSPVPNAPATTRRLAILPFRNVRQDAGIDFLSYSLADAVITKLGYVQTLRVRPSYAIEKYRNQVIEIPKVAADLDVDTLLTCNFIRDSQDLRITCQLVDGRSENILWKGAFDTRYQKLLTVQDQVSEQIIHGLELNLSTSEAARLKLDEPRDPLGYEYFLRGVDLYGKSEFTLAIQMLEKSIEIDPHYAQTWAYLGRSYNAAASFQLGGRDYYHKARAAFDRALALQPAQIETQVYMANFLTDTGQVENAVPILRDSLKTNPNHAELHWELGYAYRFAGMLKESVAECEQARKLDPNVKINSSALNSYLYLGEYERFLQSLPSNSELPFHLFYRGFAEYHLGRLDQAVANFDRAYRSHPALLQAQIGKALSEGIAGRKTEGLEILRRAESKIEARGVGDSEALYKLAEAYAVLGDRSSGLRMLQHSVETGFFPVPYFATDPLLDNLRSEPQFSSLLSTANARHEAFKKSFF